jgi:predicted transcriptional regulator
MEKMNMSKNKTNARRGRMPSLRKIREALGLNQCGMAKRLRVTQAAISMIEAGKMKPGTELKDKIFTHARRARLSAA